MKHLITLILLFFVADQMCAQSNVATIKLDNQIFLTGTVETFDPTKHTYDTCDTGLGWRSFCLIDNKIWFGSDSGMELPRNQLTNLKIKIDGQVISLDVAGMYNPNWDNTLRREQFLIKKGEVGYYLYAFFSDGAGTYTVHWKIVKGNSIRLKISNDDSDFFWQTE